MIATTLSTMPGTVVISSTRKTWKLPWEYLPNGSEAFSLCLITRTPEGERITTSPRAHSFIAEAQTWKETITGSRLPEAELRTVKEKHAVKGSVTSLSEYREKICINGSCNFLVRGTEDGDATD